MHPFELIARVLGVRLREEQASPELRSEVGNGSRNWVGTIGQASRHYVLAAFAAAMAELELTGGWNRTFRASSPRSMLRTAYATASCAGS